MNLHDALAKVHRRRAPMLASIPVTPPEVSSELAPAYALLRQRGEREEQLITQLGMQRSLQQINDPRRHRGLTQRFNGEVYHVNDVQEVCVNYRMRMLPSHRYRGPIDPEFGAKLNRFRRAHQLTDDDLKHDFFVVAPAETFDLEKRQRPLVDPLLLYRIDAQHYKLVHQWGGDLHPLRYLAAWRHRSLSTMTLYWTLFTFVLTLSLFGALAESVTNALTISTVFTFLVGWGYYSTLRDNYDEQRDRFSIHNWNQDWVF
ncbi:MAG: hypothetical protein WA960_20250 [Tunicatimonas sp.]